jgi:hypothetical protein
MESSQSVDYSKLSSSLGAERFKPEAKGESITITVTAVREVSTKDGAAGICVEGFEPDGKPRDWVAWNRHNKTELLRVQPQMMDILKITFLGTDPEASGPLAAKWFELELVESEATDDADIDFNSAA